MIMSFEHKIEIERFYRYDEERSYFSYVDTFHECWAGQSLFIFRLIFIHFAERSIWKR